MTAGSGSLSLKRLAVFLKKSLAIRSVTLFGDRCPLRGWFLE